MSCGTAPPPPGLWRTRSTGPTGASAGVVFESDADPNRSLPERRACRHLGRPSRSAEGSRDDPLRYPARMILTVPIGPRTRRRNWGPRRSVRGPSVSISGRGSIAPNGPRRSRLVGPITASGEAQVCHTGTVRTPLIQGPNRERRTGPSIRASDCHWDHARALASALGPPPFGPPVTHGFRP